jgi:integrase
MRTIPVPGWVKSAVDAWTSAAELQNGTLFRAIGKTGKVQGCGFTAKVIWSIVREAAGSCGIGVIAPHDLRRTCARLCHQAGGELEQIQFLLGHVSVQTTERYLGCKQRLQNAVNDLMGIAPESS